MGIPRLRQSLEPYAAQADLKGRDIVIDGPGLAYHVLYYQRRPSASLFELPSYSDLGESAVQWLDQLTKSGADVKAIYFDGYLPLAKEPERKNRFLDMSKTLRTYFSLYPSGVPRAGLSHKKQAGSKGAPTPPFLVPAVLEALCASETYGPVTKLVPGEADIFCARHVSSTGGMVITSDSDLLAHDLGCDGSVTFFPSIEFKNIESKSRATIHATTVSEYSPWRICDRLSIPHGKGLSSIAFQLSIDPHVSLQRAIQLAKQQADSPTNVSELATFLGQYLSPEVMGNVSLDPISGHLLDPRISEIALKFLLSDRPDLTAAIDGGALAEIPMYLPFLADSPGRTSAWETSTSLRAVAYGICRLLTTRPVSYVVENRRLQTLPGGIRVELPPSQLLDQICAQLVDDVTRIRTCTADPGLQWLLLALHLDIMWSREQGKGSVLGLDLLEADANRALAMESWDFVHLHAQVQGTYYSLRMIQQVYDFVSRDHDPLPDHVSQLRHDIGQLSLRDDIPSLSDFAVLFRKVRTEVDLPKFVADLKLGEAVSAKMQSILNPKQKKRKRKRSKKSGGGQEDSPAKTGKPSNNPFHLLGDDGEMAP